MPTLTHTLKASVDWRNAEALTLTNFIDKGELAYSQDIGSGTGVDQCDVSWSSGGTLATVTNLDIDLTALTSLIFGDTLSVDIVKLKTLLLVVTSTTTGDKLVLDSSVTNAYLGLFDGNATSKLVVGADSPLLLCSKKDGFGSVSGTNKIIRITNPGATGVGYRIFLAGTSA